MSKINNSNKKNRNKINNNKKRIMRIHYLE